jgi:mono/diheme cytochrome c family protein
MASLPRVVPRSNAKADRVYPIGVAVLFALTAAATPVEGQQEKGPKGLTAQEYEGWRQYSDKCARCHGQDALPNPVAANLLESLAPRGPMHDEKAFTGVVTTGRTGKGMPAFAKTLEPDQIQAIYAYLVGRAAKRIPPGRPERPGGTD